MPSKTLAAPPALDQIKTLKQEIHEAEQRVAAAKAEMDASARWLPSVQAKLADYLVAVENGSRDRDEDTERKLRNQVGDLAAMRVVVSQRGSSIRYADRRAVARHQDRLDEQQEAIGALHTFIVSHRHQLERELTDRALAARDRLFEAVEQLSHANSEWRATAQAWRAVMAMWGGPSPAEIPASPFPSGALGEIELVVMQVHGGAKDPRGATPMPVSLAPGSDDGATLPGALRGWMYVPTVVSSAGGLGG